MGYFPGIQVLREGGVQGYKLHMKEASLCTTQPWYKSATPVCDNLLLEVCNVL